MDSLVKEID